MSTCHLIRIKHQTSSAHPPQKQKLHLNSLLEALFYAHLPWTRLSNKNPSWSNKESVFAKLFCNFDCFCYWSTNQFVLPTPMLNLQWFAYTHMMFNMHIESTFTKLETEVPYIGMSNFQFTRIENFQFLSHSRK